MGPPRPGMQSRYLLIDGNASANGDPRTVESAVRRVRHEEAVQNATERLSSVHRATCRLGKTPIGFFRLGAQGLGSDLTMLVRAFVIAVAQRRQLVVLPPTEAAVRSARLPAWVTLNATQPWHWFAGQGVPISSLLVKSACHELLEERAPEVLEAIARNSAEADGESTARWAARSLRATRKYLDGAFRLSQHGEGSWKVGGDRWAKPEPGPDGVSGYNMGCKSLPNRVEHYHMPRMMVRCIASVDRALAAAEE